MGLVPKPRNKSAALTETNGTPTPSMPESDLQYDELVIISKKLEGMATLDRGTASIHLVPKTLFDCLPIKFVGNLNNSQVRTTSVLAHSLFDKFKRQNKEPTGEFPKEQWVPLPLRGIPRGTSFSDLCRAGKLSASCGRNYAACIPNQSGRSKISTKLTMGYYGMQGVQDVRGLPGLLCIAVEDATFCGTDYVKNGETSDPLLAENRVELEMPLVPHTSPSERTKQSRDAAKIDNERALTTLSKLELPCQKHPSSSTIIPTSSDHQHDQRTDDLSVIVNKSDQHSPVSVLEQLFEDASPRPTDAGLATTTPVKPPIQPHRINFEERSPVKPMKFHSDTVSRISIPSKQHTSKALEYARKVLETSGLNWYQLALKWHSSTQMLDPATYSKIESHLESKIVTLTPLETHLLFDHINEVLLDTYQPYYGFYPWVPLWRPNRPHFETERDFFDKTIKIVETNLIPKQHQIPKQKIVIDSMEKCGTWMDFRRELEDTVLEIVEEVTEELVEEFVFEMWIDDD